MKICKPLVVYGFYCMVLFHSQTRRHMIKMTFCHMLSPSTMIYFHNFKAYFNYVYKVSVQYSLQHRFNTSVVIDLFKMPLTLCILQTHTRILWQTAMIQNCGISSGSTFYVKVTNIFEACIEGTKYPISLEVNMQVSLINWQISP